MGNLKKKKCRHPVSSGHDFLLTIMIPEDFEAGLGQSFEKHWSKILGLGKNYEYVISEKSLSHLQPYVLEKKKSGRVENWLI